MNDSKSILPNYFAAPGVFNSADQIIDLICESYGISQDDLKSQNRKKELVFARHLSMYLLRKKAKLSLREVGLMLGRDHTTVVNAIDRVNEYLETNSLNKREEVQSFIHRIVG